MIKRLQTTIFALLGKRNFLAVDFIDDPDRESASDAVAALRDIGPGACLAKLKFSRAVHKASDQLVPLSPNEEVRG